MAATVDPGDYVADPGETNALTVADNGTTLTFTDTGATIAATGGCTPAVPNNAPGVVVTCPDTGNLGISLNDMGDQTTLTGTFASANFGFYFVGQNGGAGNDTLRGPDGGIFVNSNMNGGPGSDILIGGSNPNDRADYDGRTAAVTVTLDDVANDGESGEGDDVRSTVENVATGSGNDSITGSASDNSLRAGAGNDSIAAGAGDDVLDGAEGADSLNGDAGSDDLFAGDTVNGVADGIDSVIGGSGTDSVSVFAQGPAPDFAGLPVSITLDGVANDGIANEGDNYAGDIEDVFIEGRGNHTIVGSAAINILTTGEGNDAITGGAGNDILTSGHGDDGIDSRDGFADRVDCGPGNDSAVVDTLDDVLSNCENVQSLNVGNANEDAPPTVAFATPAENALLPGRASAVTVTATDDKGVARVVLIDDGKVVGVDTTAPYGFIYQPTGADVGNNTLIAQAVDVLNQTATAVRNVRVDRFSPTRVSQTVTPRRDRTRPFRFRVGGTVSLPTGVTKAQGCKAGTVKVTAKRGTRTRFTRTVRIRANCTYALTARIGSRGRLRFTARFSGNTVLKARNAAARTVRAG